MNKKKIKSNTDSERNRVADVTAISKRVKRIRSIAQLSGAFKFTMSKFDESMEVRMSESEPRAQLTESSLCANVGFRFEVADPDQPEAKQAVFIEANYQITYELDNTENMNDEALTDFAAINGRFNAAPYWRQYVSDCFTRATVPPYFIPPFDASTRLKKMKNKAEEPEAKTENK